MNNKTSVYGLLLAVIMLLGVITSCKHASYYTHQDARLKFSTQIVTFDTIFTSVNSITRTLKVYNPYNAPILTDIALVGGENSYYSINVDGESCVVAHEVEIAAKDSIFIFIKTNIPPNQANVPMLVADTLAFYTNGHRQNVDLLAYGQDACFILPQAVYATPDGQGVVPGHIVAHEGETIHWTNEKPYVIYGYAIIDSSATLIVDPGTRVYLHKNAGIWAYVGSSLQVQGTKDAPVRFQGDRTESWYQEDYSQWDRIWLCESDNDHDINYAVITNAYIGIQAETMGQAMMSNTLTIRNTTIRKNELYGIYARSYSIQAYNNEIADAKQSNVCLTAGGDYGFYHNTIYNSISVQRTMPAVWISNYDITTAVNGTPSYGDCYVDFRNNIVYGSAENEWMSSRYEGAVMQVQMSHCLLKVKNTVLDTTVTDTAMRSTILQNVKPLFKNMSKPDYDFTLTSSSPCRGAGMWIPQISTDKNEELRSNPPSMGAYE